MKNKVAFTVKQYFKMVLQNVILPFVYNIWRIVYWNREPELIIFADAHHDTMPFSMVQIHDALLEKGYRITDEICNYSEMTRVESAFQAIRFMKLYANAKYVFICDNFLPVSSCKKNEKTTVVQLLHSSGLLKKMGYDTMEDIPANYRGQVYRNYDLVTVSAPCCVEPLTHSMRQKAGVVRPLGTSRSDVYFNHTWLGDCREEFFAKYPHSKNKKIILWAPTFRGNAGDPYQVGMEQVKQLEKELGEDYFLIWKVHPYVEAKCHLSNCDIPTERLLPVADLLISDYSSVVNDFMFFDKPYVLFAPDLEEYRQKRGFYVDYLSLTPYVVTDATDLKDSVLTALEDKKTDWIARNRTYHLASCDGNSTGRILEYLGL